MEEFIIPLLREELIKRNSTNQYYVSKLVEVTNISKHLLVCEQQFRDRGHLFIYGMFDYLYSVLHYWNEVDAKIKEKTWDILLKSCQKSTQAICEVVGASQISRDDQNLYRNSVKMNIYLLCQMMELYIIDMNHTNQLIDKPTKGSKKKKVPSFQLDIFDEIDLALNAMIQLFQCKINKFWDPPIVEEDFVNTVTNICYRLLENPEFCKNAKIREHLTKILINMIKSYNHSLSCPVKLIQLLHRFPHMPSHLVYICRSFLAAENMTGVVRDILSEICSYSSVDLERDTQASSSFSGFLAELAAEFPNCFISLLPELKHKLDEDPYGMRNCILTILGEVVVQVYSKEPSHAANRDALIELIEEHVCDVNGFVRAKALAILLMIVEKCNLSLVRLSRIMKLLVGQNGAIYDTSSNARKNTIRIVTCVVELNLSKGLSHADLKERQDAEKVALEELEKELAEMPFTEGVNEIEKRIEYLQAQMGDGDNCVSDNVPVESNAGARETIEKKLSELKGVIFILGQMMEIVLLTESALGDIQCMLSSKVPTDVMEAISFLVKAKLSNLLNVDEGIRKMLPHVCSKDEYIKAAVTNAYKVLYLSVDEDEADRYQLIADSLSNLMSNPTYGELICMEKLIINFTESGDIDQHLIQCLWKRFRCHTDQFSALQKKCALMIFSMAANVHKQFMDKYFQCLLNDGIPNSGYDSLDLQMMDYVCRTIQNMAKSREKKKLAEAFRLPRSHELFDRLCNLCAGSFPIKSKVNWIPMTNEAINTIYLLAENPNVICSRLVTNLSKELFMSYEAQFGTEPENRLMCQSVLLTRFISVGGHLAMKQFIHLDCDVLAELKRRNTIKEEKDQVKKTKKLERELRRQRQTNGTAGKNGEVNLEEEMGLVGATADDAEAEFIRKLCENDLITDPKKLLNRLLNLVVHICSNVSRFRDKDLQKIASLSLGKMMLVSSHVCMDNIDQLINIAVRSPSEIIRANLIVPLGDLIKRFTTQLEPYTPKLYERLRDTSPIVRLNALNVLSHLILHDMIKVKGQISEITTCIVDDNPRIVHLSKIFFQELSNKDKALYNVMPDIISRLSNSQTGVNEEHFRTIMEYLMPFIHKKNQSENLFEKICARLHSANDERSWRDLSFCLSLMPFNDTMLRGLQFSLNSFGNKLHIDAVHDAITGIINNAKKNTKGEMVAVIEEMSATVSRLREQGVEDEDANVNAQRVALKKKGKSKKSRDTIVTREGGVPKNNPVEEKSFVHDNDNRKVRRTPRNPKKARDLLNDDSAGENDIANQSIASSRQLRSARKPSVSQQNIPQVFSDDEDEDEELSDDENDMPKPRSSSKVLKSRKRIMATDLSSESEESD